MPDRPPLDLTDGEVRALVLLCLSHLETLGCAASPNVTGALSKLSAEATRRKAPETSGYYHDVPDA